MTVPSPRSPWVEAADGVHPVGAALCNTLTLAQAAMLTGNRFWDSQPVSKRGQDVHN